MCSDAADVHEAPCAIPAPEVARQLAHGGSTDAGVSHSPHGALKGRTLCVLFKLKIEVLLSSLNYYLRGFSYWKSSLTVLNLTKILKSKDIL